MRGFPACVEQLLAGKASVNQPDAEGMSALLYAAKKGSAECMQLVRFSHILASDPFLSLSYRV
jgi:ankyrin repeat protein